MHRRTQDSTHGSCSSVTNFGNFSSCHLQPAPFLTGQGVHEERGRPHYHTRRRLRSARLVLGKPNMAMLPRLSASIFKAFPERPDEGPVP